MDIQPKAPTRKARKPRVTPPNPAKAVKLTVSLAGLSHIEIAALCNVSRISVYRWMRGESVPDYRARLAMLRSRNPQLVKLANWLFENLDKVRVVDLTANL